MGSPFLECEVEMLRHRPSVWGSKLSQVRHLGAAVMSYVQEKG